MIQRHLFALLVAVAPADVVGAEPKYPPTSASERVVGLAYTTWFGSADWHNVWGTPQLGCYRSDDRKVIRKHAEWIADAGVDFIFVDWSNNVDYTPGQPKHAHLGPIEDATVVLFDEFASLERRPRIVIMLGTAGAPPGAGRPAATQGGSSLEDVCREPTVPAALAGVSRQTAVDRVRQYPFALRYQVAVERPAFHSAVDDWLRHATA